MTKEKEVKSSKKNKFLDVISSEAEPWEICQKRTVYCLCWYENKAERYRFFFFALSIMNIVTPLISAVMATKVKDTFWMALLSALASFAASMLALFNVRERWTTYRTAAERIKTEYTLYCAGVGLYHTEDACEKYLSMIEKYMADEHAHWESIQNSPVKNKSEKEENTEAKE